ncbi:Patatin-like protein 2 [Nymphaea thermarum]|nr:Patatin-like protein 2 [Nymphaea thermarum]
MVLVPEASSSSSVSSSSISIVSHLKNNTRASGGESVEGDTQTLVAVSEVSSEMVQRNPDFFAVKPTDYGRFLVISIGTGSAKDEHRYNAELAAKWGILGWLVNGRCSPLIDTFTESSGDMLDFHLSFVF